jgi:hypothetical protein
MAGDHKMHNSLLKVFSSPVGHMSKGRNYRLFVSFLSFHPVSIPVSFRYVIPYRTSMKTGSPAMKKMKKDEEKSMGGPGLRTTQTNNIMTLVFILQNCG